jgi:hypothetical protein
VPSRADVFVHDVSFCLEVQLNPTQVRKCTRVREAKGAVCWLIREGLVVERYVSLYAARGAMTVRSNTAVMNWNSSCGMPAGSILPNTTGPAGCVG